MKKRTFCAAFLLLCLLAGCAGPVQPAATPTAEITATPEVTVTPTPTPEPTPEPTVTPEPTPTPAPSAPIRSKEVFQFSGDGSWGTRHYSAEYEDEYGAYFEIDVTLPWAVAEGEGYAAIDRRFEELMEEYQAEVWSPLPPEERPPNRPPNVLIDIHPNPTPAQVGSWVSFRFLENDYYGGIHGLCHAWVETYDVTTGERLGFEDFFSDPEEANRRIQKEIQRQIEADRESYDWLFDERRVSPGVMDPFDRELVYPVEGGFEVFYQWYSIGGHLQGAPTFLISWELLEDVTCPISPAPEPEDTFSSTAQAKGQFYGKGQLVYEYDISLPVFHAIRGPYVPISRYYREWMEGLTAEAEEEAESALTMVEEFELSGMDGYHFVHAEPTFCNGEGLLQICGTIGFYGLGAAHPNHLAFSHTYDRFTGERMELPDLFADWDRAREIIGTAMEPQIREAMALREISGDLLESRIGLAKEGLEQSPVFFLSTEGLTIHYNQYDIASYAEGSFDFFVPKELWEDLLCPDYLPMQNFVPETRDPHEPE